MELNEHPLGAPRAKDALRHAVSQFLALGAADQLRLQLFIDRFLAQRHGRRPDVERSLSRQRTALMCIALVARWLGLPASAAPTVAQYRESWRAAGASMSATQIAVALGAWSDATSAYRNGRLPRTAAQKALIRATVGRRRAFTDYIAGVTLFLSTSPASATSRDYDAFVREWNQRRPADSLPLVKWNTIRRQTALHWDEVKAVASGALTREQALEQRSDSQSLRPLDYGPFVSLNGAATILACGEIQAAAILGRPDVPRPLRLHAGRRIWRRAELEAFRDGQCWPTTVGDGGGILFAAELRARLGYAQSTIGLYLRTRPHLLPTPDGRAAGAFYWLTSTVDAWCTGEQSNGRSRAISRDDGD